MAKRRRGLLGDTGSPVPTPAPAPSRARKGPKTSKALRATPVPPPVRASGDEPEKKAAVLPQAATSWDQPFDPAEQATDVVAPPVPPEEQVTEIVPPLDPVAGREPTGYPASDPEPPRLRQPSDEVQVFPSQTPLPAPSIDDEAWFSGEATAETLPDTETAEKNDRAFPWVAAGAAVLLVAVCASLVAVAVIAGAMQTSDVTVPPDLVSKPIEAPAVAPAPVPVPVVEQEPVPEDSAADELPEPEGEAEVAPPVRRPVEQPEPGPETEEIAEAEPSPWGAEPEPPPPEPEPEPPKEDSESSGLKVRLPFGKRKDK